MLCFPYQSPGRSFPFGKYHENSPLIIVFLSFDSSTSYDETFYNLDIEPWEPNITTLVNFESKWKDMLNPDVQIPTPDSDEPQVLGVYEGGGYMAKGVYRPVMDCRMKTNTAPGFCPVCSRAIERMIEFYTK